MISRFAIAVPILFMMAGFVTGQPPKSADETQRRVAELEKRVEALLQHVQAMRNEAKARSANNLISEVQVYTLRYAKASSLAKSLKELLQGPDAKDLKITSDERTNSLLVRGDKRQLEVIEAIIAKLDRDTEKVGQATPRLPTPAEAKAAQSTTDELKEKLKGLDFNLHLDPQQWRDRAAWLKKMSQKGFVSPVQIELDLKSLDQAREELMKVRDQLMKRLEKPKKPEPAKKPAK